jgi:pimeloyl-ACP methyl ester carboxylesterase
MADLYAALLDALNIRRAAIVGMSAGGPSSLQFALRHPDRCRGLVMLSAINQALPALPEVVQMLQPTLNYSDIGVWLLNKFAWRFFVRVMGVSSEAMRQVEQSPEKIEAIHAILRGVSATMSVRRAGVLNDIEMITALPFPPVDDLRAPTLVVHASNDPLVPFAQGQMLADRVPGAQLVVLEDGGHLAVITHFERIAPQLLAFLSAHQA